MKQFLKFVAASFVGVILVLLFFIFILAIMAQSSAPQVNIESNSVLHLKLDSAIPELTDNVPQGQFGVSQSSAIGLNDITRLLDEASSDSKIKGIYLQTESVMANPTTAYSIARSISKFKESGKFVLGYGDYFSQSGYIIAAMADTLWLNPNGVVDLRGYGMTMPFFEDFSDKTGVDFDVYHAGKFKSAIEPYYRGEASAENRYQVQQYLGTYHDALARHIALERDLDAEEVDKVITDGLSQNIDDALSYGLIDGQLYEDDVEEILADMLDVKSPELVTLSTYATAHPKPTMNHNNKIAVIYAEGEVASGGEERGSISMEVYDEVFDRLEKNDKVKAVILRVNSPGGSAVTSDKFWKRVKDLKKQGKYIVASFGDYAASGGYYIAAAVDEIVSEPTTLTGSIGVFSMIPDFSEMSKDELGISWDTIGTGKRTFLYSTFISRSAADNALLTAQTERVYSSFKKVVAEGRDMTVEAVDEVAQGRVWSGEDALATGLIDTLGDLSTAVQMAAAAVDYDDYKILEYPIIEKTFYEELLESFSESVSIGPKPQVDLQSPMIRQLLTQVKIIEAASQTPQARMPFSILEQ